MTATFEVEVTNITDPPGGSSTVVTVTATIKVKSVGGYKGGVDVTYEADPTAGSAPLLTPTSQTVQLDTNVTKTLYCAIEGTTGDEGDFKAIGDDGVTTVTSNTEEYGPF